MKPLFNNIILKKKEEETESNYGSIIVPDMGKDKPLLAEVMYVGKGFFTVTGNFIATEVKPGDIVILPKLGPQTITIAKEEYLIIKETEILAIL